MANNRIMADEVEPLSKVSLYGDGVGEVALLQVMGDDATVINSARVSFGRAVKELDERDRRLIRTILREGHTSTLEHCVFTFRFTVPLYIRSQHHRHRTWSYNEISRRYTDYNIQFYTPKEYRKQSESNRQASTQEFVDDDEIVWSDSKQNYAKVAPAIKAHCRSSMRLYEELLDSGVCREQARGVLPQNMYTVYYGTANLNNIFKFIKLRDAEHAQYEIQLVAQAITKLLEEYMPVVMEEWRKLNER